jgi:hypothetical protein
MASAYHTSPPPKIWLPPLVEREHPFPAVFGSDPAIVGLDFTYRLSARYSPPAPTARRSLYAARSDITDLPDDGGQISLINSPRLISWSGLDGAKSPAPKSQFLERIQADLGFQSWP